MPIRDLQNQKAVPAEFGTAFFLLYAVFFGSQGKKALVVASPIPPNEHTIPQKAIIRCSVQANKSTNLFAA